MLFPKKSAHGLTNKSPKTPPPRPSKLPSKRSKRSPSANPDTKDTDMEDMEVDTDTTTAKRLPKPPPTTYPLSPPLISLRNVPSKFPPLSTPRSLLPNALLDSVPPLAKRLSSPSPNKSVSNLSTDTLMSPHQHPLTQLPLPPMLKQSTLKIALPPNDQVILCRSLVPH